MYVVLLLSHPFLSLVDILLCRVFLIFTDTYAGLLVIVVGVIVVDVVGVTMLSLLLMLLLVL